MGSCTSIRVKANSKTKAKSEVIKLSIKDKLINSILSLHSLNLDCKSQIEDLTSRNDTQTTSALKQVHQQIQSHLKEIQDLLRKFDLNEESVRPDKLRQKYLNDQANKCLKEFSPIKLASQVNQILKNSPNSSQLTRKYSEKPSKPKAEIQTVSSENPQGNESNFTRKKFRKRRNSAF